MSILNIISKRFVRIAYSGNAIKFEQCNYFASKFGKLIKDDVTNSFLLPLNSEMGRVEYEKKNGVLNLYNTEVPEHYRNQGIGEILAREVFDYCVERNLKIQLSCDFLKKFYDTNPLPQYKNLVVR